MGYHYSEAGTEIGIGCSTSVYGCDGQALVIWCSDSFNMVEVELKKL